MNTEFNTSNLIQLSLTQYKTTTMFSLPKLFRRQEVVYMIDPITIITTWLSKCKCTSVKWAILQQHVLDNRIQLSN